MNAAVLAERVRLRVERSPLVIDGVDHAQHITVSVGVAAFPADDVELRLAREQTKNAGHIRASVQLVSAKELDEDAFE